LNCLPVFFFFIFQLKAFYADVIISHEILQSEKKLSQNALYSLSAATKNTLGCQIDEYTRLFGTKET
jgi:hypothetical protein